MTVLKETSQISLHDCVYASEDGWKMSRENGTTPNGNPLKGRWVLRNPAGSFIDYDQFRSDLAERHAMKVQSNTRLTCLPDSKKT